MSPDEQLPRTTATDVYAFARLAFHVCRMRYTCQFNTHREQVFTDIDPNDLVRQDDVMKLIASGVKANRPGPESLPTQRGLSDKIWEVLLQCWEISPISRPPISAVIHAFEGDECCIGAGSTEVNPLAEYKTNVRNRMVKAGPV